jgi:uncharacterized protein (DUF58 family)
VFVLLFVGVVWLVGRDDAVLVVGIGLLAALGLDRVVADRALRDPDLRIEAPPEAVAGHPLSLLVRVRAGRYPVLVAPLWCTARPTVAVDGPEPGLVTLPAPARGVVWTLVVEVGVSGPLGLAQARRLVRVWLPAPVHVAPDPWPNEVEWPSLRTIQLGPTETSASGHDLFRGIRPYVPGDPQRTVHWKATAHHGRLMVRESEGTGVVVVRLVLDVPRPGDDAERAIARLAFVAEQALHQHWLVRLVTVEGPGPQAAPPPVDEIRDGTGTGGPPFGRSPIPAPEASVVPVVTVNRDVRTRRELQRRLAAAAFGTPHYGPQQVLSRRFTPDGDEWA